MRYFLFCLLFISLTGCCTSVNPTPPTFDLHPFSGEVTWSITNPSINLSGTYNGSILGSSGSGSLSMDGFFLMKNEPLSFNLSGHWILSGHNIVIKTSSGSVLFGPRNQHNQTILKKEISYELNNSLSNILTFLGDTHKPEAQQKDDVWVYMYDTHDIHISGKDEISLYYHPQWSRQPLLSCDTTPDILQGKCLIQPPSRDAFISQPPLVFKRSTTLATNNTMTINN